MMKKSELKQLIREQVKEVLREESKIFNPKDFKGQKLDKKSLSMLNVNDWITFINPKTKQLDLGNILTYKSDALFQKTYTVKHYKTGKKIRIKHSLQFIKHIISDSEAKKYL